MNAAAEKFFQHNHALPTMPEVASRLLKSFDDENISLTALAHLIGKDSTLTAKVLRLANSARYSPSHTISSLNDAAAALGMDTLRNLSLAACISGAFPVVQGLNREIFWRHSVSTAGYARVLSRLMSLDADTAYLAGLMLRTGQLLMAMTSPEQVAEVEANAAEPGSRFSLEMRRFGCTHADVTASLAKHWHFPAKLIEAFADANTPLEIKPFSPLAAVLHIAEVLADAAEHHDDPVKAMQEAVPELIAHMHLELDFLRTKIEAAGDLGSDVDQLLN